MELFSKLFAEAYGHGNVHETQLGYHPLKKLHTFKTHRAIIAGRSPRMVFHRERKDDLQCCSASYLDI
jgi:hypothetical protein